MYSLMMFSERKEEIEENHTDGYESYLEAFRSIIETTCSYNVHVFLHYSMSCFARDKTSGESLCMC